MTSPSLLPNAPSRGAPDIVPVPPGGLPAEAASGGARLRLARRERFCQKYVADPNATRAAIAAGYAPRSAAQRGSRLLGEPEIAARIRALQGEVARRSCSHADALLAKLEAVYVRAMENQHFQAAGKAVELQARLIGLSALAAHLDGQKDKK